MVRHLFGNIDFIRRRFFGNKGAIIDKGSIYVLVIMTLLIFGGYILVGGTLPTKLPLPSNNLVTVQLPSVDPTSTGLQLHTLVPITNTPMPTPLPLPTLSSNDPRVIDCQRQIHEPQRPGMVWNTSFNTTSASNNAQAFKVFYVNDSALVLGAGAITAMKASPSDKAVSPTFGDTTLLDTDGFYVYPAIYVTDNTSNALAVGGDAQVGGTPQQPGIIYGTWKAVGGQDPAQNGFDMGQGADPLPVANGPGGSVGDTFSTELVWNSTSIKAFNPATGTYAALQPGHNYRVQILLHDGDKPMNVAAVCVQLNIAGGANPAPNNNQPAPNAKGPVATSGHFTVTQAGGFVDPTGKPFIMKGLNAQVPDALAGAPAVFTQFPGMTAIRLVTNPDGDSASDIDTVVQEYTSRGIVVEIEDHWDTQNCDNVGWYTQLAQKYLNNPYVWLETPNEPKCDNLEQSDISIINAIRGTGFANPIGLQPKYGYDESNLSGVVSGVGTTNIYATPHIYGSDWSQTDIDGAAAVGLYSSIDEFGDAMDGYTRDAQGIETITGIVDKNNRGVAGAVFWAMDNGNHPDGADSACLTPDCTQLTPIGTQYIQPWLK